MLAGLLFASREAEDRPDRLVATLPFGGVTLIEYQARLAVAAGATQIVTVVPRLTPELMGALARVGQRGVAVDTVRSAAEAAGKLHPLAHVLVMADGVVTAPPLLDAVLFQSGDALAVVPTGQNATFERVGGQWSWAGLARLEARRVAEAARLPADYDLQSTLVRVAAQAQARPVEVTAAALADGHDIVRRADTLEIRGRQLIVAQVATRRSWFDRYLLAPIARWTLPPLVARGLPGGSLGVAGLVLGLAGVATIVAGRPALGLTSTLIGTIALALGATLGSLRDEPTTGLIQDWAAAFTPAAGALALGYGEAALSGDEAPVAVAISLVAAMILGERAIRKRRLWWGTPAAYLCVITVTAIIGLPYAGLIVAAAYATTTLTAAIEVTRDQA